MTKLRPPLSLDAAMARYVVSLGSWAAMAKVTDRAEQTVRAWGDHHQPDSPPCVCAVALDVAHQKAGYSDRPLFDFYKQMLAAAEADAFTDQALSATDTADVAREAGGAVAALAGLMHPGADADDEAIALKECEDLYAVIQRPIARLGARRLAAGAQLRKPP